MVMQSVQYEDKMAEILERLGSGEELNFSSEAGFSIPSFSSGIVQHLGKLSEKINNDDVVKFTDPKLSLYAEVAIPTKLQGATYPSYSYVLFMPESDLILYREMLRRNVSQSDGSYPDKRISLFNIYINIIEEFASQEILKKKKPKDMTRGEVIAIMQGIADEGLDISTDEFNDFKIGDIRNEKKVSNQKVDELIKRFYDVQKELERITRLNTRYDFCMTSGGVNYYWLRLDQVF